jgi:predicted enzyme related to lactoylglutathione lyase
MVDMDGYSNFSMQPADGQDLVAGICHARDENVELPQQWLIYVTVGDLEGSLRSCRECGGEVVRGIRPLGEGRFAVIRDPAGAVCALDQRDD